ncbi:MAG: protein kinase, partial [Polyangiaceae bacterium]
MADPESAVRIPTVPILAGPANVGQAGFQGSPPPPSAVGSVAEAGSLSSPTSAVLPLPKRCPTCNNRYPLDFVVCPRDATTLDVDMDSDADPLLGQVLGGTYRILRIVGEGGMGKVYEAQHLRIGHRKVAVKVLHPEYSRDRDVVSRFQKEAESASSITHPNVIQVFDVDVTPDGRPYLVGEFLEGEELGDHLDRLGKIDIGTAVGIARQVC